MLNHSNLTKLRVVNKAQYIKKRRSVRRNDDDKCYTVGSIKNVVH